jgi:predicted kinase
VILTVITGLPGSGKSYYAAEFVKGTDTVLLDDPMERGKSSLRKEVEKVLKAGTTAVIVDPNLVNEQNRQAFLKVVKAKPHLTVLWIFFENSPDACRINVARRQKAGDKRDVEASIYVLSKSYSIPKDELVEIVPVWAMEAL